MAWRSLCVMFIAVSCGTAQEPIRFARTPDVSPDGKVVAFSYLGDIWAVDAVGGVARAVTMHEAHDINPAFSPDGRWIAFSSTRHGSYDVFVVATRGGRPRRLTFDSASEIVMGWTPDGKNVLFQSSRSTSYPSVATLYRVPFDGGSEVLLPLGDAKEAAISPRGDQVAYVRGPGLWYRKGYRGSANDEIWLANSDGTNHRQLTNFNGQDSSPMWSPDGTRLYFVSEQFGTSNICFVDVGAVAQGTVMGKPTQLTRHVGDGVRRARISGNGEWITYECGADIWLASTNGGIPPRKLAIEVYADDKSNVERLTVFTSGVAEYAPVPDDKGFAIVVHGEIFFLPQGGGKGTRLTEHPSFDHGVNWAPDGKKLIFLSDRSGRDNVFLMESDDPEHPEIPTAIKVKTRALTTFKESVSGASYSPDGKSIAFLLGGRLWTMNSDGTGQKPVVNDPTVVDYDWSPDSKYFVYSRMDGSFGSELYILPAAGGKGENVTRYATWNNDVSWSRTGMKLAFVSERAGPSGLLTRPYVLPLQKPAVAGAPPTAAIDFDDIHYRAIAVSPFSASAATIAPDGNRVAYRSGDDLWVVGSDGNGPMRLATNLAPQEIRWSKNSASIFFRDRFGQLRIARPGVAADPATVAFNAKMVVKRGETFVEMFEQSWRWLADSFYDSKFHEVDWNAVRAKYRPMVDHVGTREDLYALITLMLGELNASHLGIFGAGPQPEELTADLGLLFDESLAGPGKKIAEVLKRGPADKRGLNLKAGEIIVAIDRTPITETTNLSQLLNGKVNESIRLDVLANAAADPKDPKARRKVEVQGANRQQIAALMYDRWCERNDRQVRERSGGKIGYIHIPSMDQPGLDRFVRALYSDHFDKEAIVLDVRFNGGGYTHEQVLNYLTGKEHTVFKQRNGGDGLVLRAGDRKWTKPLVLLINNQSYSDAEIFPSAFRTHGLGKLVGQPTGGFVIGTGSVGLIDGSTLRLPRIGVYTAKGVNMEKEGVAPDFFVEPAPDDAIRGIDRQLEKAVDVVKQDVIAWKKAKASESHSTRDQAPPAHRTTPQGQ